MSSGFWGFFGQFCKILECGEIHELQGIHRFRDRCLGAGYVTGHQVVRKTVLRIACFAYSLLL